jgi:hypothetical protein
MAVAALGSPPTLSPPRLPEASPPHKDNKPRARRGVQVRSTSVVYYTQATAAGCLPETEEACIARARVYHGRDSTHGTVLEGLCSRKELRNRAAGLV